jgi:hypothetical protein
MSAENAGVSPHETPTQIPGIAAGNRAAQTIPAGIGPITRRVTSGSSKPAGASFQVGRDRDGSFFGRGPASMQSVLYVLSQGV